MCDGPDGGVFVGCGQIAALAVVKVFVFVAHTERHS